MEFKYGFETALAEEFPRYLMYDVNNVCNAKCTFCPQSEISSDSDFDPSHITWEDFTKTITEAAQYKVDLVRFTGDGEPLLHPRMADMIAFAKDIGLNCINLTTNGSLLKGRILDRILASPPNVMDVSIDAFNEATYQKYRVGLDFKRTVNNVLTFLERRDPKKTKVVVSMISHPGLDAEVEQFRAFWSDKVEEVAIRKPHTNLGSVAIGMPTKIPKERWPCVHLWQRITIDFRGHIRFCPIDWYDKSYIGKVSEMTIYEAWHSPQMHELRQRHLENNYKDGGVCKKCVDWTQTNWGNSWLDLMRRVA